MASASQAPRRKRNRLKRFEPAPDGSQLCVFADQATTLLESWNTRRGDAAHRPLKPIRPGAARGGCDSERTRVARAVTCPQDRVPQGHLRSHCGCASSLDAQPKNWMHSQSTPAGCRSVAADSDTADSDTADSETAALTRTPLTRTPLRERAAGRRGRRGACWPRVCGRGSESPCYL